MKEDFFRDMFELRLKDEEEFVNWRERKMSIRGSGGNMYKGLERGERMESWELEKGQHGLWEDMREIVE